MRKLTSTVFIVIFLTLALFSGAMAWEEARLGGKLPYALWFLSSMLASGGIFWSYEFRKGGK